MPVAYPRLYNPRKFDTDTREKNLVWYSGAPTPVLEENKDIIKVSGMFGQSCVQNKETKEIGMIVK